MKRVIIESPYAGNIDRNLRYLRACMRDCTLRGESPYASHALLTQPGVLRDAFLEERRLGIAAGYAWWDAADLIVFYVDLGWSSGMKDARTRYRVFYEDNGPGPVITYEERKLPPEVLHTVLHGDPSHLLPRHLNPDE